MGRPRKKRAPEPEAPAPEVTDIDQRELELQALVGAIRREHVELAVGSSVSLEGEVEPIASVLVGNRRGGVNLAVTGSSELEAGATFAVFERLKRVTPMLEIGYRDACRALAEGALAELRKVYAADALS